MEVLSRQPLPAQIDECIDSTPKESEVELLRLVSALLKYTVPEAYLSLPEPYQNTIARVFRTAIGLGNLVARIRMFSRSDSSQKRDVSVGLDAHTRLLEKVLAPGLVAELMQNKNALARKEVEKLLFKGQVYSIVREAVTKFDHFHVPVVLRDMDAYTVYLSKELLGLEDTALLSVSLLSFGNSAAYFDVMFCKENSDYLHLVVGEMRRFERKMVLVKFLDFAVQRYFRSGANDETTEAISVLNKLILDNSVWDELLLEKVVSHYNYHLNSMVALLVADSEKYVEKLLALWGSTGTVKNEPIVKQGYRTHLLLCLCAQLPAEKLRILLKLQAFVSAITSRLSSLSNQVKSLGVFFADKICTMAEELPIFNMNDLLEMRQVDLPQKYVQNHDFDISLPDAWEVVGSPQIIDVDEPKTDMSLNLGQLNLDKDTAYARDASMSDEEDDPTLANRKTVAAPIYIRDLLSYLSVDTKDPDAYEKRKIALKLAPTLLRQKLAFGSEVSFYAKDLLQQLVGLSNHYEEDDFETLRLNAMIAVVVGYPSVTTDLCQLLLTGDYSLQQRLCLLSAMSFGARALRGYKDEVVEKSFTSKHFPTQTLPQSLHDQYTALDYGYSRIENTIQNDLMRESSEQARDEILGGKVLRVSARLKRDSGALEVSKDQLSTFRDIVGRLFFFPLVAVWYESGGINIGHYTPVLIAHYLRTLSLILHCAYPAALDFKDMAAEYLTLVTPLLQNVDQEQLQVIESIVTGVLLICETLDTTYLVTNFDGNLRIVESVIVSLWESIIDDRVKSLCAGLILRLGQIRERMERTILDQMNGGFYT